MKPFRSIKLVACCMIFSLQCYHPLFSQLPVQTWLMAQVQFDNSKSVIGIDCGYRMNNLQFDRPRQYFGRFVWSKKWNAFQAGIGYVFFDHIQTDATERFENRPFLQAVYSTNFNRTKAVFRFRHEERFFESESLIQRSRMQMAFKRDVKANFGIQASEEFFLTHTTSHLVESRTQLGCYVVVPANNQFNLFYQLNYNSINNKHLMHVIGFTFFKRIQHD